MQTFILFIVLTSPIGERSEVMEPYSSGKACVSALADAKKAMSTDAKGWKLISAECVKQGRVNVVQRSK